MLYTFVLGAFLTSCQSEVDYEVEAQSTVEDLQEPEYDSYIVISGTDDTSLKSANQYLKALQGVEIIESLPGLGATIVKAGSADFSKSAEKNNLIVLPNYQIKWIPDTETLAVKDYSTVGDNETYRDRLWGLDAIEAPKAWETGNLGGGTSVYVLDSGIDAEHPDLSPNLNTTLSKSFVPGEHWNIQPGFYFNHGTHVAGTIAAAYNDWGVIGVAPKTELVALKVLSEFTGRGSVGAIAAGIYYAADNDADVINMSLGSMINKNGWLTDADGEQYKVPANLVQEYISFYQAAINYAYNKGTTIIASAGNDALNADGDGSNIKLPAGLNNVIAVSSTAPEGYGAFPNPNFDIPASYTNYGVSLVDIAAPGGDFDVRYSNGNIYPFDLIWSTISNGWGYSAGTSMASPHVSGVAALIISKNGGDMDPAEVEKQLLKTADKVEGNGQNPYYGHGRVNAYRAVTE
ncbi:peptidase S8 [Gramella sp. BOM4]|nr:peptidase S8 [Christiangramia bathymodioli]